MHFKGWGLWIWGSFPWKIIETIAKIFKDGFSIDLLIDWWTHCCSFTVFWERKCLFLTFKRFFLNLEVVFSCLAASRTIWQPRQNFRALRMMSGNTWLDILILCLCVCVCMNVCVHTWCILLTLHHLCLCLSTPKSSPNSNAQPLSRRFTHSHTHAHTHTHTRSHTHTHTPSIPWCCSFQCLQRWEQR